MTAIARGELELLVTGEVRYAEPMSRHTTLKVGGPAEAMVFPRGAAEVAAVLRCARSRGLATLVVGGGSNLLVRDGGLRGIVLNLKGTLNGLRADGGEVLAGAGVRISTLLNFCLKRGLAGLEFLAGMPGLVGGAVRGNAGAYGGNTADRLSAVRLIDGEGGDRWVPREALEFRYRFSSLAEGQVVAEARFGLTPDDPAAVKARFTKYFDDREATQPSDRSAGCIFKNPVAGEPAGKLIDLAGLKGLARGDAVISTKHGNFLVNRGAATAADVLALIAEARARVRRRWGVDLELEVQVVGEG
jgi:UDP-N-acetylmuramate dehydrogenase